MLRFDHLKGTAADHGVSLDARTVKRKDESMGEDNEFPARDRHEDTTYKNARAAYLWKTTTKVRHRPPS